MRDFSNMPELCRRGHLWSEHGVIRTGMRAGKIRTDRSCKLCNKERHQKNYGDPKKREAILQRNRKWIEDNPEKRQVARNANRIKHIDRYRAISRNSQKNRREKLRRDALNAYGNACTWCGDTNPIHLQFDHIHNDGKHHRKTLSSTSELYLWLRNNNYPDDVVQLLCANCHTSKTFYRVIGKPFDPMLCIGAC